MWGVEEHNNVHTANTHHLVLQLFAAQILCFRFIPSEAKVGLGRVEFYLNVVVREGNSVMAHTEDFWWAQIRCAYLKCMLTI